MSKHITLCILHHIIYMSYQTITCHFYNIMLHLLRLWKQVQQILHPFLRYIPTSLLFTTTAIPTPPSRVQEPSIKSHIKFALGSSIFYHLFWQLVCTIMKRLLWICFDQLCYKIIKHKSNNQSIDDENISCWCFQIDVIIFLPPVFSWTPTIKTKFLFQTITVSPVTHEL